MGFLGIVLYMHRRYIFPHIIFFFFFLPDFASIWGQILTYTFNHKPFPPEDQCYYNSYVHEYSPLYINLNYEMAWFKNLTQSLMEVLKE